MTLKKITGYTIYTDRLLGKGSYGSVYKGLKDNSTQYVAVKVVEKRKINSDEYMKAALLTEISILKSIKSQNVVALYEVLESSHNYYLIQELCDGDLENYLKEECKMKMNESKAIEVLTQICNGLLSLVREGIVHRDLKPANIMLLKGHAKIGDFGFAKKKYKAHQISSTVGTPLYMSPQILKSEPYTSKCDIWALGFIFYEMMHGTTPWTARTEYELVKNIQTKNFKLMKNLSSVAGDFIKRCLEKEEAKRISWDELFLHDIFKGHFKNFSQTNVQFQNKLKRIMSDLRFKIKEQNIDLKKLFQTLGFQQNHDLSYKEFSKLCKSINPDISSEEQVHFFEKMDQNMDGSVSLRELEEEMERNHIKLTVDLHNDLIGKIFASQNDPTVEECFDVQKKGMSCELQVKVRKCFTRLQRILKLKKLTLYRTFVAYDSDKSGLLEMEQFYKILKRLDSCFTKEETEAVFELIDKDKSKTIEFEELNSYYCKVNGIPERLDLPADYKKKLK